ncbi:unnamed protein product [Hyaloperonospora brassicae]|uniref:JmjC domain-containing protein n=1 Tax=Hyaloperonospora brassicae TaxID=162125 RepID=A0AAV0T0K0_HYABA|nr:unnamed protein product [Hyaloperonospora brassicae]
MAATGLGEVASSSRTPAQTLELAACSSNTDDEEDEAKRDYRAEDGRDSEADCGFSCSTVNAIPGGSKSRGNYGTEEEVLFTVKKQELAKQKLDASVPTQSVSLDASATEFYKVDGKRYTAIRDTVIVTKLSSGVPEETREFSEHLREDKSDLTAAAATSATVIDCTTMLTWESAATQSTSNVDESTSSCVSSDGGQTYSREEDIELKEFVQRPRGSIAPCHQYEEMNDDANGDQTFATEAGSVQNNDVRLRTGEPVESELAGTRSVEVASNGGMDREPENLGTGARNDGQKASGGPRMVQADVAVRTEHSLEDEAKSKCLTTTKPGTAAKRKQSSLLESDLAKSNDGGDDRSPDDSAAPAPTQTPERSTRTDTKKKKKKWSSLPGAAQSRCLRRSPRVKVEPLKLTYSNEKQVAGPAVLAHFDRLKGSNASSPATPGIVCKYSGTQVTISRGVAARHLEKCPSFGRNASQLDEADDDEDKAQASPPVPSLVQAVKLESGSGQPRLASSLVRLMGTKALAAKLKQSFQRAPFAGNAPISRFQQLIGDDVTGLRHLNVFKLLDAINHLDGPILQLHVKWPGVRRTTGQDEVGPVSKAKARCLESCSLRFPTPRRVADHFIAPLAKELGLEYSMRQHTATLTSCPLEGAVLDWRFHRTETVVFQLRGESIWRTKMSQVELPCQCFHPQSWLQDDMIRISKVHRMATIDKTSVGFLSTPDEDRSVLNKDEQVAAKQREFVLKPGSVAYLPSGAWFKVETKGPTALWIEVQLSSTTYEELALSALEQIALGDKRWRTGVQLYPGNRAQLKTSRHRMEACIESLYNDLTKLEGGDLLPEYMGTEDMQELIAHGLIHKTRTSSTSTSIEVDLTNPKFKLKHEKVFRNATYRVNPVAVLMSDADIPHLTVHEGVERAATGGPASEMKHRVLKRTPKPKQALHTLTHRDKCTYFLDELFGNVERQPQLHVTFHCSAEQSRMVEWLRCRDSKPFDLNEFGCSSVLTYQSASPARRVENGRKLLRFLCFVGYITQVKSP